MLKNHFQWGVRMFCPLHFYRRGGSKASFSLNRTAQWDREAGWASLRLAVAFFSYVPSCSRYADPSFRLLHSFISLCSLPASAESSATTSTTSLPARARRPPETASGKHFLTWLNYHVSAAVVNINYVHLSHLMDLLSAYWHHSVQKLLLPTSGTYIVYQNGYRLLNSRFSRYFYVNNFK